MKKINVYMFHYGSKELPIFIEEVNALENVNLILGPTAEEHEELMHIPFYREAFNKKIYAFMSDYWRMWIILKEGPGLYMDSSFIMHNSNELVKFILTLGSKDVFFWEKPNETASCIFYLKDDIKAKKYLEYYDSYKGNNIRKLKISPFVLNDIVHSDSSDCSFKSMLSVLDGDVGIEKEAVPHGSLLHQNDERKKSEKSIEKMLKKYD